MTGALDQDRATGSTGFVIIGMHRSGTSALAGWFGRRGLCAGDRFILPGHDNPEGYWEHEELVTLDDLVLSAAGLDWRTVAAPSAEEILQAGAALSNRASVFLSKLIAERSLWFMKDPRLCRTLPFWRPHLDAVPARLCYLHILRDPWSVADSLARRDGLTPAHSHLLWSLYNLEAELHTRGRPRIWLDYGALITGGDAAVLAAIGSWLPENGRHLSAEGNAIRPEMVHARGRGAQPSALFDSGRLYDLLSGLRGNDGHRPAMAEIDRLRDDITGQVRTYRALLLDIEGADLRARADALATLAQERLELWRRTDEQLRIITEQRDHALRLLQDRSSGES